MVRIEKTDAVISQADTAEPVLRARVECCESCVSGWRYSTSFRHAAWPSDELQKKSMHTWDECLKAFPHNPLDYALS